MNLIDRDKPLDDLVNRLPKMAAITEAALPVLICEQPVIKAAPITREQVEKMPVVDEKIKTAVRAGVFAIINSKYKNQIFWDDARGLRGGPYHMNFYEAATILLEFIDDPSLSKDQ